VTEPRLEAQQTLLNSKLAAEKIQNLPEKNTLTPATKSNAAIASLEIQVANFQENKKI